MYFILVFAYQGTSFATTQNLADITDTTPVNRKQIDNMFICLTRHLMRISSMILGSRP